MSLLPPDEVREASTKQRKHKGRTANTCAPSSKVKRLQRQLDGILAHLEVHPLDGLSRERVSKIKQLLNGG